MLYILLATLTDEGLQQILEDDDMFNEAANAVDVDGAQVLARYAVLGEYDFVIMAEADEPEAIARLSVEIGARAHVNIQTLTAVSAGAIPSSGQELSRREHQVERRTDRD